MTKNKLWMTVSLMALAVAVTTPAMANPSVLCSVRDNYKSAEYQPGVDVKGKPVAPADMTAPAMTVPKVMRIPLTIDLVSRLNEVIPTGLKLENTVGLVEISETGQVMINGKDLTGPADSMCDTIAKQKAAAMKTKDAPKVKKAPVKPADPVAVDAPAVDAAPAPEVAAPEPVPAPVAEPVAEPVVEPVAEPAPATPQVLEPAPEPAAPVVPEANVITDPAATPPAAEALSAPAAAPLVDPAPVPALGDPAAPAAPAPAAPSLVPEEPAAQGEILSPSDNGSIPRPPMDPLAATPPAPAPTPDGVLSGGAQ